MKWAEVDLEKAVWKYVATKTDQALIVPLSRQAVAILAELKPQTGDNPEGWVFPSPRGNPHKPVNFRVVLDTLKYLGISSDKMTGHGFRASAATLLEEMLGYDPKFINMQLAHLIKDPNGNAYRRAQFLEVRCEMMQVWADAIDKLREGEDADAVALWAKEEKARYAANKDAATREKIFAISSSAREQ
jgi:integrase